MAMSSTKTPYVFIDTFLKPLKEKKRMQKQSRHKIMNIFKVKEKEDFRFNIQSTDCEKTAVHDQVTWLHDNR